MNKRGQVAIFIIVAILLVAGIILFISFGKNIGTSEGIETSGINSFVENCLNDASVEVVYAVGNGGGYYLPPELSTETGVPIYYSDGNNYMPSKEDIQKQVEYWTSQKLFFCTKNFADFPEYEITQGEIKTTAKISGNKVDLNVVYPITIKKGSSSAAIKSFKTSVPIRFGIVYDSVSKAIEEQKNSTSEGICISCLLSNALENDLYVRMNDYDNETVLFVFEDKNSIVNDKSFEWVFANKYKPAPAGEEAA